MKTFVLFLRNNLTKLPFFLGNILAYIPYNYRPGLSREYSKRQKEIRWIEEKATLSDKKTFIFNKMKTIVDHAFNNVPFYRDYYTECSFHPDQLERFEDLKKIPIINKKILQKYSLVQRSFLSKGRYKANTGGSSGEPLTFYITPDSMGHEWAHIHHIWKKFDYKPHKLKLTFGGISQGEYFLKYDSVRHHYALSIFKDFKNNKQELLNLFRSRDIQFLHGYPSAIYELALFCKKESNADLLSLMKKSLKGAFLGSEFPVPLWRQTIEVVFDIDTTSWYGHTERAVLAFEKEEKYKYHPFISYGFAEAIEKDGNFHLLSTSYYNFASPLIRYDTEDIIKPLSNENGILESFQVTEGRIGDFVIDAMGKKIPLTGLIFGRHHPLFDYCQHIQISQIEKGKATILYTPLESNLGKISKPSSLFDTSDVKVEFDFKSINSPIKTPTGKVKLLVKEET